MLFCIANRNYTRHNVVNLKAKKRKYDKIDWFITTN